MDAGEHYRDHTAMLLQLESEKQVFLGRDQEVIASIEEGGENFVPENFPLMLVLPNQIIIIIGVQYHVAYSIFNIGYPNPNNLSENFSFFFAYFNLTFTLNCFYYILFWPLISSFLGHICVSKSLLSPIRLNA